MSDSQKSSTEESRPDRLLVYNPRTPPGYYVWEGQIQAYFDDPDGPHHKWTTRWTGTVLPARTRDFRDFGLPVPREILLQEATEEAQEAFWRTFTEPLEQTSGDLSAPDSAAFDDACARAAAGDARIPNPPVLPAEPVPLMDTHVGDTHVVDTREAEDQFWETLRAHIPDLPVPSQDLQATFHHACIRVAEQWVRANLPETLSPEVYDRPPDPKQTPFPVNPETSA